MKKLNLIKLFLLIILAITWGITWALAVLTYTQKEGYEDYNKIINSRPKSISFSVMGEGETTGEEIVNRITGEYGEDERVVSVEDEKDYILDCKELKESTMRDVELRAVVYGKQYENCMPEEFTGEMGIDEVWIPKYFTPCEYGRYKDENYIDGEEWVGKKITVVGNKAVYIEKEKRSEEIAETYSMEVTIAGTYDNVKAGMQGNVLLYSEDSYVEFSKKRLDKSGQELLECIHDSMVYVYAAGYEEKQDVFCEMQEKYPEYYFDFSTGSIDDGESENMLDTKNTILQFALVGLGVFTLFVIVITLLLMKKSTGVIVACGWLSFAAGAGLVSGAQNAYQYASQENKIALTKADSLLRFLEYPLQPSYVAFAVGAGLIVIGVAIWVIKFKLGKRQKVKEK